MIKQRSTRRIFVNRTLDTSRVKAVGFDMDHTLLLYKRANFENLAFRVTLDKCIAAGYPEELSELRFDHRFLIRGLLVDIDRGNILKIDSHKYVKLAYHGSKILSKEERDKLYNRKTFRAQVFLSVDTFFALSEIHLFLLLVDYMDARPGVIQKDYRTVYNDLKHFIDLSHRDGSIKEKVLGEPDQYVRREKKIGPTLERLINSGKQLFLLTNSEWEYTSRMMEFLFSQSTNDRWRDYFRYVIVGSGKPGFFTGTQPFYEVQTDTGFLKTHREVLSPNKVYHGGNAELFQKLVGFSGDEILYVGDHIFGDILRSKGTLNWRTMLIVEELGDELKKWDAIELVFKEILQKFNARSVVDEELHILLTQQARKNHGRITRTSEAAASELELMISDKREELNRIDEDIKALTKQKDHIAHPLWGELMRTGLEHSRFADQVFDYACLYTSKVTNLLFYSPAKRYFSAKDLIMLK